MLESDRPPLIWLFDIDGTLIDSGGAGGIALGAAMKYCWGQEPQLDGISFAGRTDRAIVSDLLAVNDIEATDENIAAVFQQYLEILPETLSQCQGQVLPGVIAWLERIQARQQPLGLLTGNMVGAAKIKLEHFGLWDYFSFGGYGDDHSQREKVAASAVDAAKEFVGETPELSSIWVIGDTPADIIAAKACSLRCLAVATGSYTEEQLLEQAPDIFVKSLHDASPLVRIMGDGAESAE